MVYFSNTAPTDLLDLQVNYNINWFYLFLPLLSLFLPGRDVALGECEDSLLLDKRARAGAQIFFSLSRQSLPQRERRAEKPPDLGATREGFHVGGAALLGPDLPACGQRHQKDLGL